MADAVTLKTGMPPRMLEDDEMPFPAVPDEDDEETVRLEGEAAVAQVVRLRRRYGFKVPEDAKVEREEVKKVLGMRVWIGHGDADTVVRYQVGRGVYKAVKVLGMEVEWKRYEGLGHWWRCPDEIDDVVRFMMNGGLEVKGYGEWFTGERRKNEEK